jgi:hypothetical protein
MPFGTLGRVAIVLALACAMSAAGCGGGIFKQQYEYEEELYLQLDGSATAYVNASIPALVALRGADLNVDPRSRPERERLRALFAAPGARVTTPTFSRRDGRRFAHIRIDVDDVRQLARIAPLAWSTYRFERQGDILVYTQTVGKSAQQKVGSIEWNGDEMVSFKMHLPSEIPFNNSPKPVQRGNILQWEQPLADRLVGTPLEIEAHLEPESILYTTLMLFGGTIVAAALTFAVIIWWIARRGRAEHLPSST